MRFAVLEFPGSNCDHDLWYALARVMKQKAEMVWHEEATLPPGTDCVMVPGGFSYGDYLRCGAIARFSPVMKAVAAHAAKGGLVWGICNGFQILTEAGLLPGALMRNKSLSFLCQDVFLKVEHNDSFFTSKVVKPVLRVPIAHGEGSYTCDEGTLKELEDGRRVLFRYCDAQGFVTERANPNGSLGNIAGILSARGNVLGMMPHPERCAEPAMGNTDGRQLFESCLASLSRA